MNTVSLQVYVAANVALGDGCDLQAPCIVGKAPRGAGEGELPLAIGAGAVIRPFTTIYAGSTFGARLQTGQGASVREDNIIGDDVSIGTSAVLEFGNRIGSRVRIHSGCFLELVTIEDDVFVGPNVVFTDDPHPMNCPRYAECKGGPVVRRLARIGANSTILPGVEIGEGALVGAGSCTTYPPALWWAATRRASSRQSTSSSAPLAGTSIPTYGRPTRLSRNRERQCLRLGRAYTDESTDAPAC